jgi:ornithine cyclodeaminase/alanine dehydrogenase-like protein (mu-crystallin family)
MPLLLRERDVVRFLAVRDAIAVVEAALREMSDGRAFCAPRSRVRLPSGLLHNMSASLPSQDACGIKVYTATPSGVRFVVLLFSVEKGDLLAILEADRLGQIRTGAASAVATRLLARPDAAVLALLGTGYQAETQLEACAAVRQLREVRVWSRTPERAREFCERLGGRLRLTLRPAAAAAEACRGADIIVTATSARDPVLHGEWIDPGAHVNAMGSNQAHRRELDAEAVARCEVVATDLVEQARLESGDLILAAQEGRLDWSRVADLGNILSGRTPGRGAPAQRTLFKSNGIALEDVAAAALVYRRALGAGVGEKIDFEGMAAPQG